MSDTKKFPPSAGIAIGPILFILALLALIAVVMSSSGGGNFQVASGADRIATDITSQANLVRSTINQCNLNYQMAIATGSVTVTSDPYPSSNTSTGTTVSALTCGPTGGASLWGAVMLPQPTQGFNAWTYIDASAAGGGRCIWTTPTGSSPKSNLSVTSGLTRAASKFNSSTSYSASNEVIYNPASTSQKFVVWITMPTGTADSHCLP
ncbi:MAG: hypothetical protein KGI97_00225 [Alphaproteobacteria bacterium]|nr:hypothetical protein [Alphaproteobacteria bacterium]